MTQGNGDDHPRGHSPVVDTSDLDDPGLEDDAHQEWWVRIAAATAIALALGVGIALYYKTEVCDEQLIDAGKAVTTCRHLQAADPPVIAVGLVMLVALTAFFSKISGFGLSLKREVRQTRLKANAAQATARSAQQTSEVLTDATLDAATHRSAEGANASDVQLQVEDLIEQYNLIRTTDARSSPARSSRLTAVVSKLIATLSGVDDRTFPVETYLSTPDDDGRRMAGYAFAYANPNPAYAPALVRAIMNEVTRFGEYWAIRALRRVVATDASALDFNSRRELEGRLKTLSPGTDRAFELRRLLEVAEGK